MTPSLHPDFHRALWEATPQASLAYGWAGQCLFASSGFARMVQRPLLAYETGTIDDLWQDVHPEDQTLAFDLWSAIKTGSLASFSPVLLRWKVRSGDWKLIDLQAFNRLDDPRVSAIVIHLNPVADRKKTEDLLISERERLLVTLRSISDGVITTDTQGQITLVNKVAEELVGWAQSEALGRPLDEVFRIESELTGQAISSPVEHVLRTGQVLARDERSVLVDRSGRRHGVDDSAAPIRDTSGKTIGAILVFRDVTNARRMAAERIKMQKLESIGVLAGGIAHDFNNILSAILGNASLGTLMVEPEHPLQELLIGIQKASRRASDLTQQLLTFSKGGAPVLRTVSLQELVSEGVKFLLQGSGCEYHLSLPADLAPVLADPGQLGQVVQNLVLNAKQAMKDTGRLSISAHTVDVEPGALPVVPGRYVRLEFVDEGPGIEPELLERIFEPYFTTKSTGNGLGLSVVWSVVKSHRGWVQATSVVGVGTRFTVWLPSARSQSSDDTAKPREVRAERKGTALVMDDESEPRFTLVSMLRHLGYQCRECNSGETAIDSLSADGPVDLIVLDLTIRGGMGGVEALPYLKSLAPQSRVIVTSGYSIDPIMADYHKHGFDGVLKKPFNLGDLALSLDEAMVDRA